MFTSFLTIMSGNTKDYNGFIKKYDGEVYELLSHVMCSICHEIFTTPLSTNCGHTFCGGCIRRVLSNKNNSGCPLCKNPANRRDLDVNGARSQISSLLEELPLAFKEDVENINVECHRTEDHLFGCQTFELGKSKSIKNSGKKRPGRPRKSVETVEKLNISDGFVPVVKKDEKIQQYHNKRKEIDDLVSVSQMEEQSYMGDITPKGSDKLKSVEKVTHEEKINVWLDKAGENLFNVSNNSLFGETNKTQESEKIEEVIIKPSMIRVDYNKEKSNSAEETKDEYEFIASQNTGPKRKRPRRSTSKKKLPDFKAIQHFTKEAVKRNQISFNETKQETKLDDAEMLDEILFGSQKNKSPEPSSDELLADTIKVPTITASQKFEKLLEETVPVREEKKHILYSSNSDESLKCTYESDPKEKPKGKEPVPGCSKDSSDGIDFLSDDSCLAKLFMTPKEDKKPKPKRKRSNENVPKKHANAPKKRSRVIEVLQEHKNDSGIVCRDSPKNLGRLSNSSDLIVADGKGNQGNISNLSRSPGWSRVSGLKSDFESPKHSKRQKFKKKSLNVSGGEKTPVNTSKSSLCIEVEDKLDRLDVKNEDDYIDDLSQTSEFVTGFSTQQDESKEENFKKMVEAMEEQLDRSSDLTFESEEEVEVEENADKIEVAEANTNGTMIIPETESPREENEKVEDVMEEFAERTEPVIETFPDRAEPVVETIAEKAEPILERFVGRRRNRKTIPFTLLGKIKKRKRTSTIFLQLGRLAPFLKKSKSTVVKLVFPKGASFGNKRRRTSTGVQTLSAITRMSPVKISAGIQTSQKVRSEGQQTTQREFDNCSAQTSQVAVRSTGVQMTQANTASSAGVQTTQIEKASMVSMGVQMTQKDQALSVGVQTSQIEETSARASPLLSMRSMGVQMTQRNQGLSAGVQTSQVDKTAVGVQSTPSLLDDKEQSPKSKDLFPTLPSEAYEFDVDGEHMEEWENIETVAKVKTPVKEDRPSSASSTQSKLEKFVFKSRKSLEEEPVLMDADIECEFNTTWEKTQKKSQRKLSDFFSAKSSDSDDVPGNRSSKKIRKISSQDLSSLEEIIRPEKYEGRQLLPLNVQKLTLSDTIDLATPEPSQKSSQELVKRVFQNIDQDLARIKNKEVTPAKRSPSQESIKTVKSQNGEDSDSDIFVEQTPPKENSRILDDIMNISVPRAATQHFTPPHVNLPNTEGTEIIADSIPPKQIDSDSFLMLNEKFVTPPRSTPKTAPKAPIFKTPHLGFPSKESFFNTKKETEEPDENNQNMINNEAKNTSVDKTEHVKAIMKSWTKSESPKLVAKRRICIVTSCCSNRDSPAIIQKFREKFKVEFSNTATKNMTHLVVGLYTEDKVPNCTPKLLFAMANRKWVVSEAWIEACLKLNTIVPEEPYESLDSAGGDGCRKARLSKELLFRNFEICMLGDFELISKEDFADLVMDCGATVIHQPDKFSHQLGKIRMILVDRQCLELDVNQIQELFKKYKTPILYKEVIIQSLESYTLVNFTPYLLPLITEKDLLDLGYPPFLARHEEESECI